MEQKAKPISKSRTAVFNAAVLILVLIDAILDVVPEKYRVWLLVTSAVINFYLRIITKVPIKTEKPKWLKESLKLGMILLRRKR